MIEHDPVISEYQHDKFRPREAEVLMILRKVASLVKPIMRRRGWKVGILTEFYPPERNLLGLNWNAGQKICLRLRYPTDEKQFLPMEQVVDTMLHELSHIVHGPHDEAFHNLWNQLRDEHEQLIRKGYTGEGFLSQGRKLGGGRIPMHEARRRARAAAEKRKTLSAGSGHKLGGAPVRRGVDIRKVIADAAQRRITVTKGCASGTERGRGIVEETNKRGTVTKAEDEDVDEEAIMQAYIELIEEEERQRCGEGYVPPSSTNPTGSMGKSSQSSSSRLAPNKAELLAIQVELDQSRSSSSARSLKGTARGSPSSFNSRKGISGDTAIDVDALPNFSLLSANPVSGSGSPFDSWSCEICTLSNPPTYLICDACGTERTSSNFSQADSSPSLPTRPSNHYQPERPGSSTTDLRNDSSTTISKIDRNACTTKAHQTLSSLEAAKKNKPLGWVCHSCGTFMENQWWTCAGCGEMKLSS